MPAWYPMRVFSSYPTPHIHPRAFFPCLISYTLLHIYSILPIFYLLGPGFLILIHFHFIIFFFPPHPAVFFLPSSIFYIHTGTHMRRILRVIATHEPFNQKHHDIDMKLRIEILIHTFIHSLPLGSTIYIFLLLLSVLVLFFFITLFSFYFSRFFIHIYSNSEYATIFYYYRFSSCSIG